MTRKGGDVLSYHFSKPEDASYYVLKRSDLDHYFEVAKYTANPIKETTGENLVQPRTEEASSEPPRDKRVEKDADSISYFDVNLPLYYQREGWQETKRRSLWGYRRLSARARELVNKTGYQDETLMQLLREVIHEDIR